jgi:hypothetical protein
VFKHGIRVGSVSPDRMLDPLPFADKAGPGDRKALAPPLAFLAELAVVLLSECESARGPDADRHVKLLIQFAVEGSLSGAYSQSGAVKHSSGAESSVKRQGANDGSGSSAALLTAQHPDLHRSLQLEHKGRNGQVWYAQYESIRTHLAVRFVASR